MGDDLHHAGGVAGVLLGEGHVGGEGKLGQVIAAAAEGLGLAGLNDHAAALGGMHVHLGADGTHGLDVVHQLLKVGFLGSIVQLFGEHRPLLGHDGLGSTRQSAVDLLGDEGHEGMQQLQRLGQHVHQHLAGVVGLLGIGGVQANLGDLDVPVAVNLPDEVLHLLGSQAQLELIQIVGDGAGQVVQGGQNPLVAQVQLIRSGQTGLEVLGQVHHHEAGGVPQLVGEVAAGLDLLVGEAHVVAGGGTQNQGQAQGVGAVLGDDLQRVDAVAQTLGHLAALGIAHQAVDQYGVEGGLAGVLQAGEDHAAHPEGDDVVAGDQGVGGIEVIQVLGLVRPAQGAEGPQGAGEPGVQGVLILAQRAAALGAGGHGLVAHMHLAAGIAVVGGNPMAPPQLTADAPVAGVLHPVIVLLVEALGHELDAAVPYRVDGRTGQGHHAHEPLLGNHGLDGGAAAVAGANIVGVGLDLLQIAARLQVGHDGLAGLVAIHAGVLAAVGGHVGGLVQHLHDGQVVALAHLEVVGVMRGGDLHHAGAELHVHVGIGDDGDLLVQQGQQHLLAVQVLVALVVRMDGHGGIAQHGLGTGGGQNQELVGAHDGVLQVPEAALLVLILHLGVGDAGLAVGAPVDDALAAVDQVLIVQILKDLQNRLAAALVHGEALAVPVAGAAQLLQLAHDAVAVLVLPGPGALQEAVAAQHLLGQALFLHLGHNLGLGGDGSMVGAGHPQSGVALHALVADQDVLPGLVHGMTHVQLASHVRRRHHDGVGLFALIRLGVEVAAIQPEGINVVFHAGGIIQFFQFFH